MLELKKVDSLRFKKIKIALLFRVRMKIDIC